MKGSWSEDNEISLAFHERTEFAPRQFWATKIYLFSQASRNPAADGGIACQVSIEKGVDKGMLF